MTLKLVRHPTSDAPAVSHIEAHAARDGARLAPPPVDAAVLVALLVRDEQLDRVAEDRVGKLRSG